MQKRKSDAIDRVATPDIMMEIIDRKRIDLSETQNRMLRSAWGHDAIDNSTVEKITYISDGLKVKGFIALPAGKHSDTPSFPCIIWNRGGFGDRGALDDFTARGLLGQIAGWGYVVLASQYRGNMGGEGQDEFGGADVNDILNLIPLAEGIPQADRNIWGIEGWSRGGMMTYLTLTRSDIFKTAVISGGISDLQREESGFIWVFKEKTESFLSPEEAQKMRIERSAVNFADKLPRNLPFLILHGTADDKVTPKDALDMGNLFLENKMPFRLVLFEDGDHYLRAQKKEVDKLRKMWFDRYLK